MIPDTEPTLPLPIKKTPEPMNVTEIPFNKLIGIKKDNTAAESLQLSPDDSLKNHLGTFHASAQFALAEACSGLFLQQQFPTLVDEVLPVVRKSEIKFRRQTQTTIHATASCETTTLEKFENQLSRKGRAAVTITVVVTDEAGMVVMTGTFEWFIQKMRP
jgi:acyl-coenzyme A thioesterase PaaI-like protein